MHLLSQAEDRSAARSRFPRSVGFYQACAGYYVAQASTAVIPLSRLVYSFSIVLERNYQCSVISACPAVHVGLQNRRLAGLRSRELNLGWYTEIGLDHEPDVPAPGVPAHVADRFLNDPVYLNAVRLLQGQLLFQLVRCNELVFESLLLGQMGDGVSQGPFQRREQSHISQN